MKTAFLVVSFASLLATHVSATTINNSKSNNLRLLTRSTVVTASADLPDLRATLVYRVPAGSELLLTQMCIGLVTGGVLLQVDGASIAHVDSGQCQTFSPGVVVPPEQALTCTKRADEEGSFCMINGVLATTPKPTPMPQP